MKKLLLLLAFLLPLTTHGAITGTQQGGTGIGGANPYSVGQILYASGATTLSKLDIGNSGECLKVNGGVPVWLPCGATSGWSTTSQDYYTSLFRDFSVQGNGYLAPTTTRGIVINASSTITSLTTVLSTSTNATTTSLGITGISNALLKTTATGGVVPATAGTDYQAAGSYLTNISGQDLSTADNSTSAFITASALTGYVPYTGATANLDLGASYGVLAKIGDNNNPSFTFNADSNTGIYSAGSGIVNISNDGVLGLTVNGSGTEINNGTLTITALSDGIVKSTTGVLGTATNGTDYTLITATTCTGSDKVSAISASGAVTCSAVSGGGASFGESWAFFNSKAWLAPTTTVGIIVNASSTITSLTTILSTSTNATTSQLAITGIGTCTAGQALKPSATGGVSCQAVSASASAGGNNREIQFNDSTVIAGAGGFVYDKVTGRIQMGGGVAGGDTFQYALHIATTSSPQFEVASSTQDIFEAVATSTAYESGGFNGTRVTVGTSTKSVAQDQLFVDGRINTGDWSYAGCEGQALNRSVAQVTDAGWSLQTVATGAGCGLWGYDEATNGQASFISTDPVVGGYVLLAAGATGLGGATVANDGMAMRPFNSYLNIATNTPVMSARVRISNMQFASTSIVTVGFGNYTISGTAGVAGGASGGFAYPTRGCWLTASSTQANWIAVCTNGSNATTTVNTGVATSSVTTGTPNGRFQDLRIEAASTTVKFYITTPGFPVASSSNPVATITTNIPLKTVVTPIAAIGVYRAGTTGQASTLHVSRLKLWWKEPLQ